LQETSAIKKTNALRWQVFLKFIYGEQWTGEIVDFQSESPKVRVSLSAHWRIRKMICVAANLSELRFIGFFAGCLFFKGAQEGYAVK
jgi:hypothetical protein